MFLQRIADNGLWSSLREMERVQQQLNRLLASDGSPSDGQADFPPLNVWTNENGVIVTAELAGVSTESIELSVLHDTLTIRGSRQPEVLAEGQSWLRQERGHGQFSRTLRLPFAVESDGVQAHFRDGVLQITLPRAESEKPRKIAVSAK
ncbi:MAG: Hsp20/alpha crystallin family protein [Cyanobacteria bacterium SZAS LIN-2]|nr:Hsp20/alpha crystallin family protein [Cyanobacteria bacterium SZAS LIN-3]MBS1995204.1 Hsp20/alpha crystallin family protein [Cyanobacteria bacterium SZAS LIN-2]